MHKNLKNTFKVESVVPRQTCSKHLATKLNQRCLSPGKSYSERIENGCIKWKNKCDVVIYPPKSRFEVQRGCQRGVRHNCGAMTLCKQLHTNRTALLYVDKHPVFESKQKQIKTSRCPTHSGPALALKRVLGELFDIFKTCFLLQKFNNRQKNFTIVLVKSRTMPKKS